MAEKTAKSLRVVVVTPERAVLDEAAEFVVLPLYDGEAGVLPGRAAFVGQLGPGELRIKSAGSVQKFFIDGGFAQIRADVVNVLTPRALASANVNAESAAKARTEAEALPATNAIERETRAKAIARASAMIRFASKA